MRYQLSVARGRHAPERLELQAASAGEAQALAIGQGYTVLSVRPERAGLRLHLPLRAAGNKLDVAVFVEQLHDLLVAGLSVIEALDAQARGATGGTVAVIGGVVRRLREGQTLSAALAADSVFPELLVALVQASELTSDLPQCLSRYLEHHRRVAEVRHRLVSTAIYPGGGGGLQRYQAATATCRCSSGTIAA